MAITVTPHGDMDPCPRVEVAVDAIPTATHVTITRTWDGQVDIVRRGRRAEMQSPTFIVDYEVPLGVDVEYSATGYTATGAVVEALTAPTRVDVDLQPSWVLVQSPLAPTTTQTQVMSRGSLSAIVRPRVPIFEYAMGSGTPFGFGEILRDPADLEWTIYTHTDEEASAFFSLIRRAGPVLIRSVWPVPLPRLAYVLTGDVTEIPVDAADSPDPVGTNWRAWSMALQLVRPPAANIAVPVYTYDAVKAMYAGKTYDEVKATRPGATYIDWVRDPRP